MSDTTIIAIHDEPTRRVLSEVLWSNASSVVGEQRLYNDLSDFGWGFVHRKFGLRRETSPRDQVEATFALLDATPSGSPRSAIRGDQARAGGGQRDC